MVLMIKYPNSYVNKNIYIPRQKAKISRHTNQPQVNFQFQHIYKDIVGPLKPAALITRITYNYFVSVVNP